MASVQQQIQCISSMVIFGMDIHVRKIPKAEVHAGSMKKDAYVRSLGDNVLVLWVTLCKHKCLHLEDFVSVF